MFTGIVEQVGTVRALKRNGDTRSVTVECGFEALPLGSSVSVDGICLTVTASQSRSFSCDISPETSRVSTAGRFEINQSVNLERALRIGDSLGGHWVMGHVDQTVRVVECQELQDGTGLFLKCVLGGVALENQRYLIPKGSIAVCGVSLTLNAIRGGEFEVMLIPHTLERTTLKHLHAGTCVNLEFDWMTKTIVSTVDSRWQQLREAGECN